MGARSFAGHVPHKFITRYCFGAAYLVALLHERLGVGLHDRSLHFTNSISRPVRGFDWGQVRQRARKSFELAYSNAALALCWGTLTAACHGSAISLIAAAHS